MERLPISSEANRNLNEVLITFVVKYSALLITLRPRAPCYSLFFDMYFTGINLERIFLFCVLYFSMLLTPLQDLSEGVLRL